MERLPPLMRNILTCKVWTPAHIFLCENGSFYIALIWNGRQDDRNLVLYCLYRSASRSPSELFMSRWKWNHVEFLLVELKMLVVEGAQNKFELQSLWSGPDRFHRAALAASWFNTQLCQSLQWKWRIHREIIWWHVKRSLYLGRSLHQYPMDALR